MSNLVDHARRELTAIGMPPGPEDGMSPGDRYNTAAANAIMELIEVFSKQGHSGFSANYVIQAFSKVAAFEPLAPVKGTDDEWVEVGESMFQNARCAHVFKDTDGRAYDIESIIFRDPDGGCFTSRGSSCYIEFPYTPKRVYVDRDASGNYMLPPELVGKQRFPKENE
jgi:hypothetical protein